MAIVCAVGENTQYGISKTTSLEDQVGHILNETTILRDELDNYTIRMGYFAYTCGALFFVSAIVKYLYDNFW